MNIIKHFCRFVYPPKCILCDKVLPKDQTDLCHNCRISQEEFGHAKKNISFIAQWTAMWYYRENVRESLHRYKFYNNRCYAAPYGRLLAMHLLLKGWTNFDMVTWVPISAKRRNERGYDQGQLLCKALAGELGLKAVRTLKKYRHVPPQSSIPDAAARRANVLGAYRAIKPGDVAGKRILLLDDIITTGATASECARVLLTAGAKEVFFAAIAATDKGR